MGGQILFELCSDLVIPPLKMLYNLYYVTVMNKSETETEGKSTWKPAHRSI